MVPLILGNSHIGKMATDVADTPEFEAFECLVHSSWPKPNHKVQPANFGPKMPGSLNMRVRATL